MHALTLWIDACTVIFTLWIDACTVIFTLWIDACAVIFTLSIGKLRHSWWVCLEHASKAFIHNKLRVSMESTVGLVKRKRISNMMEHPSDSSDDSSDYAGINKKKAIKAGKQPKGGIASESEDSEDDRINTESDSDPEDDVPLHKVVNVTTKIPKGGKPKTTRTVAPRSTKARDASSPGHGGRSSGRRGRN